MNEPNEQPKRCHVCDKDVSNGGFARIPDGKEWILLCSPTCALRYMNEMRPAEEANTRQN
ncbi:MAG: hypothetical protein ACLQU4_06615 [Limisphaerales bacterium]